MTSALTRDRPASWGERRRAEPGTASSVEQLVGFGDGVAQRLLGGNLAEQCLLDTRQDDGVDLALVRDRRDDIRVLRDRRLGGAARAVLDQRGRGTEVRVLEGLRRRGIDSG